MASTGWSFHPVRNASIKCHQLAVRFDKLTDAAHVSFIPLARTFGTLSGLSLGSRLWLNFGLSNMRAKGLADVLKGLGAKRL